MASILFFDPDKVWIGQLKRMLKHTGYQMTVSRSMEEACCWLTADRYRLVDFDLLLLSNMPEGTRESEFLLALADESTLPVVLIHNDGDHYEDWYKEKIILCSPDELMRCLEMCLGRVECKGQEEFV